MSSAFSIIICSTCHSIYQMMKASMRTFKCIDKLKGHIIYCICNIYTTVLPVKQSYAKHLHNGVFISQLKRYSRYCNSYQDFLDRGLLLTMMLLNQGLLSLRKIYGRHHDLVDRYGIAVSQMLFSS